MDQYRYLMYQLLLVRTTAIGLIPYLILKSFLKLLHLAPLASVLVMLSPLPAIAVRSSLLINKDQCIDREESSTSTHPMIQTFKLEDSLCSDIRLVPDI